MSWASQSLGLHKSRDANLVRLLRGEAVMHLVSYPESLAPDTMKRRLGRSRTAFSS